MQKKKNEIQIANSLYKEGWRVNTSGEVVIEFERDGEVAVVKYPTTFNVTRLLKNLQENGNSSN